jgi:hypothetical protein
MPGLWHIGTGAACVGARARRRHRTSLEMRIVRTRMGHQLPTAVGIDRVRLCAVLHRLGLHRLGGERTDSSTRSPALTAAVAAQSKTMPLKVTGVRPDGDFGAGAAGAAGA